LAAGDESIAHASFFCLSRFFGSAAVAGQGPAHDRDSKFAASFDEVVRNEGIKVIHTPIRAPQANAYAERFVRTVRAECLDWLLIVGRRHLETVLHIWTAHYNQERPHRALALLPPEPTNADPRLSGEQIKRRDRLGGLIHEYHRAAA
jgi:putative transposase